MKIWTCTIAAACAGVIAMATPAMANSTTQPRETASEKVSYKVSYRGLDLNTMEGQRLLEQRVEIAARRVCGYDAHTTGTRLNREARACLAKARASARAQVAAVIEDQRRGG